MDRLSLIQEQLKILKFDFHVFMLWTESILKDKSPVTLDRLELGYFEKLLLAKEIDNYTKFFLVKTLYQLKVKVGRKLKLINHYQNISQSIDVEKLSDLTSYQQILKVEKLIGELSWQDPGLKKLALIIWKDLLKIYFPLVIKLENQLLAETIVGYVNKLLVPNQSDANNELFVWIEDSLRKISKD